jgi:hypothetical protein
MNLDCGRVKTTTGNFSIIIITLGCLYFVLSCRPTSPKVMSVSCGRRADNRVSGILARSCAVKARASRCPGLGGLGRMSAGGAGAMHLQEPNLVNSMQPNQAGQSNLMPEQPPASRSGSNMRIDACIGIHTTSEVVQPCGDHRRASTSSCSFRHLILMMQDAHGPCNVSFVLKYSASHK